MHEIQPSTSTLRRRRQRALLLSALLHSAPALRQTRTPTQALRLERALDDALDAWPPASPAEASLLTTLVSMMRKALASAGVGDATPSELGAALARALMAQANDDIAREAMRAGHAEAFAALQPWLEREIDPATTEALGRQLAREPGDLDLALARLRRRYRQRIESGLALWSADAGQRNQLRRQLHAALALEEPQP